MARPDGTANPDSKYSQNKKKQADLLQKQIEQAREQAKEEARLEAEQRLAELNAEKERELSEMNTKMQQAISEKETEMQRIITENEAKIQAASKLHVIENENDNNKTISENGNENIESNIEKEAEIINNHSDNTADNTENGEDTNDLLSKLRKSTATKKPDENPPISEPSADDERFTPPPPEAETVIPEIKMKDSADGENVDAEMSPDDSADLLISGLNAINKFFLPKLYEREFFTPLQRHKVKILLRKVKMSGKGTVTLTDDDLSVMEKFEDYETYVESVPFTKDEIQNIKTPLKKLMVGRGMTISPTWALIIALLFVMLPRYGTVLAKKWENRNNPPRDAEPQPEPENEDAEEVEHG